MTTTNVPALEPTKLLLQAVDGRDVTLGPEQQDEVRHLRNLAELLAAGVAQSLEGVSLENYVDMVTRAAQTQWPTWRQLVLFLSRTLTEPGSLQALSQALRQGLAQELRKPGTAVVLLPSARRRVLATLLILLALLDSTNGVPNSSVPSGIPEHLEDADARMLGLWQALAVASTKPHISPEITDTLAHSLSSEIATRVERVIVEAAESAVSWAENGGGLELASQLESLVPVTSLSVPVGLSVGHPDIRLEFRSERNLGFTVELVISRGNQQAGGQVQWKAGSSSFIVCEPPRFRVLAQALLPLPSRMWIKESGAGTHLLPLANTIDENLAKASFLLYLWKEDQLVFGGDELSENWLSDELLVRYTGDPGRQRHIYFLSASDTPQAASELMKVGLLHKVVTKSGGRESIQYFTPLVVPGVSLTRLSAPARRDWERVRSLIEQRIAKGYQKGVLNVV